MSLNRKSIQAFLQRVAVGFVLIPALILFVAFASELRRGGGLDSFATAGPEALEFGLTFAQEFLSGEVEIEPDLGEALLKSLGLLAVAMAIGVPIGLAFGFFAAARRHGRIASLLVTGSVIGVSAPSYVVAMFLIWAVVWIFRETGVRILPVYGFGWDERLILPALVLAARPLANMFRVSNSTVTDVIDADFVRTARSKGLHPQSIYSRHVLRNVAIPLLAALLVSVSMAMSMLPIVEMIFSWPGIGLALLQASDTTTTVMLVLPLVILFVMADIVLEFTNRIVDPRTHARGDVES
jgi:peptide/nickel transport system permease protein